jgi:hypothetical protein
MHQIFQIIHKLKKLLNKTPSAEVPFDQYLQAYDASSSLAKAGTFPIARH